MSEFFTEGITPLSLDSFTDEGYSNEDALMLAESLLEDAIPCITSILPSLGAKDKLLVKFAVLEMAKFIQVDFDNFDRATSPFQSETVGSYTYHKATRAVRDGDPTNVPGFDRAVNKLASLCTAPDDGAGFSVTSEQVFKPGFSSYRVSHDRGWLGPSYRQV